MVKLTLNNLSFFLDDKQKHIASIKKELLTISKNFVITVYFANLIAIYICNNLEVMDDIIFKCHVNDVIYCNKNNGYISHSSMKTSFIFDIEQYLLTYKNCHMKILNFSLPIKYNINFIKFRYAAIQQNKMSFMQML